MPSSSWRSATWSTTVCVSETDNRTRTPGFASAKSQSRSGTTEPPGPVDAPSSSVPLSASSSRATSCRSCSSCASSFCAAAYSRSPASVGSTRRPERSRSCVPSRCSSERICRLTAGCVTPSRSAAWEKLCRSTTAQKAASWRVSISVHYAALGLYDRGRSVATPNESFIQRFATLTQATPRRGRDGVLRALDIAFASLFLFVSLPLSLAIALLLLATDGLPLFYRGERVGRGGRIFQMLKFRTLKRGAEARLGPFLGEQLVRRTKEETTTLGGWLRATQ